jgi:hypothetical protein
METKSLSINLVRMEEKTSNRVISIIQSTLLVFLIYFPVSYINQFIHEAGHALVNLTHGLPVTLIYAHPFSFVGFARPMVDYHNVWQHASGSVVELLATLIIFILLWKRRSIYTLPFLMLFPWSAVFDGIGGIFDILGHSGDFNNLLVITGLPAIVFYIPCFILAVVGVFLFISLLPLLGLAPEDRKTLLVLPAGMTLYSILGLIIAYLFVPGSPVDLRYHLGQEILSSAYYRPLFMIATGVLLSVIYITLYRKVYKRLPIGLRTELVNPTWRVFWYPGLLFTISVIIGLIVIH